jgi:chemotaxis signal transduction protein
MSTALDTVPMVLPGIESPPVKPGGRYGIFLRGGEKFALPIRMVWEVLSRGELTSVPRARPGVAGLLSLRGEIVAVLVADRWLGLEAKPFDPTQPILVLRDAEMVFGIQVDRMQGVGTIPDEEVRRISRRPGSVCRGEWEGDGGCPVQLIDGEALREAVRHPDTAATN